MLACAALRRLAIPPVVLSALLAATGTAAGAAAADWPTFGHSLDRQGASANAGGIARHAVPRLRLAWRVSVDGAVNAQPLVARRVRTGPRRVRDLVYVATEHDQVVALDARSGRPVWRRRLGSPQRASGCAPSPDGRLGISGTLALDRRARRVYAADGHGRAWALDLANGRTAPGWPVAVTRAAGSEYVWGALAVSRGRLYVPIASQCDSGDYHGGIVAVDTAAPGRRLRWEATAGTGLTGGAVWGWGGVSIDRRDGDVYAATGNSNGPNGLEDAGFAERVVRLSSDLVVRQSDNPLRGPFGFTDRDFGTTPVLFQAKGCPAQLVALDKDGEGFLYDRDRIADGPVQRLSLATVDARSVPLIGVPSFDAATRTLVLLTPSDAPSGGVRRGILGFRLTSSCRLVERWRTPFDAPASGSQPTIDHGVAYVASGRKGVLRAYDVAGGRCLWSRKLGLSAFANPTVAAGSVYAADWRGAVWAFRPSRLPPARHCAKPLARNP